MIDFRYHLVSIVSIFLALAVGIALGAGPLKSQIGDTFTSELTSLRDDKAALKDDLDAAYADADKRDEFTAASNRVLLAGRLPGVQIALLVLPGADNNLVQTTAQSLTAAGAEISGTVRVQTQWAEPESGDDREGVVTSVAESLGLADAAPTLESVLGIALQPAAQTPPIEEAPALAAIAALTEAGYIKHVPAEMPSAQGVVIVAGPVDAPTLVQSTAIATNLARLVGALDRTGGGAVVVSDDGLQPTSETEATVVGVLRADENLDEGVTTIDDGSIPMGQASVVLGLMEQMSGGSGRYGLAPDATAVYPSVAGAATQ